MATHTIRNLPESTKLSLLARARLKGFSLEEEVRMVLNRSVTVSQPGGLGSTISALFKDVDGGKVDVRKRNLSRAPTAPTE